MFIQIYMLMTESIVAKFVNVWKNLHPVSERQSKTIGFYLTKKS